MKIPFKLLFRPSSFHNYSVPARTMFIRSIEESRAKEKAKTEQWLKSQPYNKFFVIDFEATCDNSAQLLKPQEIIEFPSILVTYSIAHKNFRIVSCFHSYVRPMIHKELSEYCTQLTGITQDMIHDSPLFDEVFHDFCNWFNKFDDEEGTSIIVTSGNWDLGNIFLEQCKLFPSTIQIPKFMRTWINIKKLFALTNGRYPYGINNMLNTTNSKQIGNIHSGTDDCANIITIMNHLAQKGCIFKATNKLIDV